MPIPTPHKGESKNEFVSRCTSAIWDEYKGVKGQAVAICESTYRKHRAKASLIITAGSDEYVITPEGPEKKTLQIQGGNTDPINDNTPPVKNPAPPAVPFPPKVAPVDSQPTPSDKTSTRTPGDNSSEEDNTSDEYVGSSMDMGKLDPKPISPPGAGIAPNPDNDSYIPKGGSKEKKTVLMGGKDDIDSLEQASPRVAPENKPVFLGDGQEGQPPKNNPNLVWEMASIGFEVQNDPETGLASWPLTFRKIESDFKRPNKPDNPNQEPKTNSQDSVEEDKLEKPYVI